EGVGRAGGGDRVPGAGSAAAGVGGPSVADPRTPTDACGSTAAIAASAVLRRLGPEALTVGLELRIEKGLPLAGGMGGSAASAVAGAVAADAILGAKLGTDALLEAALGAEAVVAGPHADNVAPSLLCGAGLLLRLLPPPI